MTFEDKPPAEDKPPSVGPAVSAPGTVRRARSRRTSVDSGSQTAPTQAQTTYDIDLPVRPQVTKITATLTPGNGGEDPLLTLEGINLQRVAKVTVGGKEAEIVGDPEHGILVVRVKGLSIKKDVAIQIPLTLETPDGMKVSVLATVGKPAPPKTEKSGSGDDDQGKAAGKPPEK